MDEYNPERGKGPSASERIICSFLIESLNATPLNSIIYISRAALMLTEEKLTESEIDGDLIRRVFSVAERLSYASHIISGNTQPMYKIDFSSLKYKKDIDSWSKMKAYDYFIPNGDSLREDKEKIDKMGDFDKMVHSAKNLTETGYRHMVSDFLLYAVPIAQTWMYKLTQMISSDTYAEMLKNYWVAHND